MLRSLLMRSVLALPALVRADDKANKADKNKDRAAKAMSDDRLDALEEKLQALLKEIQSLRSDKKESGADREKKALTLKLADEKKVRDRSETEKKKDGTPRVVRIGDDGK